MQWFGEPWNTVKCVPATHAATPVGKPCTLCAEEFIAGDCGMILFADDLPPSIRARMIDDPDVVVSLHRECFVRSIAGSLGHLKGTCPCYGGEEDDPPGMTLRQAAKAAFDYQEAHPLTERESRRRSARRSVQNIAAMLSELLGADISVIEIPLRRNKDEANDTGFVVKPERQRPTHKHKGDTN